jgi:hypothetical protein
VTQDESVHSKLSSNRASFSSTDLECESKAPAGISQGFPQAATVAFGNKGIHRAEKTALARRIIPLAVRHRNESSQDAGRQTLGQLSQGTAGYSAN